MWAAMIGKLTRSCVWGLMLAISDWGERDPGKVVSQSIGGGSHKSAQVSEEGKEVQEK